LFIKQNVLPDDFVHIKNHTPSIIIEPRYYTSNNFIGTSIEGYEAPTAICTKSAAEALRKAQIELNQKGLGLKVFDAYRPQRAVDHFVRWAQVMSDTLNKKEYYPDIPKSKLFELGYIAEKSGHTRGSTADLTIIDISTKSELDMGSPFDFFGPISGHGYKDLTDEQKSNRSLLRSVMEKYGFKAYEEEWWHYTLINEPYPDTYFDFLVK